jgi:hypothetical protein
MDRRCGHCPYDEEKPSTSTAAQALLRKCREADVHVSCPVAVGEDVCCKAHFDLGHSGKLMKIAERHALVDFVSLDDYEKKVLT